MSGIEMVGWVLIALVASLLLGIQFFATWSAYYWVSWAVRWLRHRHTYVQVTAEVNRVWYDWLSVFRIRGIGQIWVTYQHDGRQIQNRLTVPIRMVRRAEISGIVQLLIDPKSPQDAMPMWR